jgi:CofH/MqnC-like protein
MEGMTAAAVNENEALAILAEPNVIAVGARGDEERRRRHGLRTTFVRVFEVHVDAVPASLPSGASAGEIRLTGKPASVAAAVAAVKAALRLSSGQARGLAGAIPLTAFSLADLSDLVDGSAASLTDLAGRLAAAGLEIVAEAPVDALADPVSAVRAVRDGGLQVPRLTVREMAEGDRVRLVSLARDLQSAVGGVRAFAPLPRVTSVAQPTTGYDDVKVIAMARLLAGNIDSIQVDWPLYGPKLAQVALTMGADDVDGVSALEGDLGRRRSPIEEIRGNIVAAGLEPVERDARFERRGEGQR